MRGANLPPFLTSTPYNKGYGVMADQSISEKTPDSQDVKRCSECHKWIDKAEFSKDRSNKDGLQSQCKLCNKKYGQDNKEAISEWHRQYHLDHQEYILEEKKRYRQEHKEYLKAWHKKYQQDNKEKKSKYAKQHYQDHKKERLAQSKIYNQTAQGKKVHRKAVYKRRVSKFAVEYESFDLKEIFERDNYICQLCGKKTRPDFKSQYHDLYPNLDHIVPLSLGGSHTRLNTQCLCHKCNADKSNSGIGDQLRLF